MSEALKPCPFCGEQPTPDDDLGFLHKGDADCFVGVCYVEEREVVEWNRRADLAGLPEGLAERAYKSRGGWDGGRITGQALDSVLHDILAWHEQQKDGRS
jgi:hypothetical protein